MGLLPNNTWRCFDSKEEFVSYVVILPTRSDCIQITTIRPDESEDFSVGAVISDYWVDSPNQNF